MLDLLLSKYVLGALGAVVFLGFFYQWVDMHGSSARQLAAIEAAQAARNGKLMQQKNDDPLIVAKESAQAAQADADYKAAQKNPCIADQATADALNILIGD